MSCTPVFFKAMTSQQHFPTVPRCSKFRKFRKTQEVKEEKKAKVKEEDEKTLASTEDGMAASWRKERMEGWLKPHGLNDF